MLCIHNYITDLLKHVPSLQVLLFKTMTCLISHIFLPHAVPHNEIAQKKKKNKTKQKITTKSKRHNISWSSYVNKAPNLTEFKFKKKENKSLYKP